MGRSVVIAVDDIFFVSKIRAAAEHLGITVRSVRTAELVLSVARETHADLIIVDLHTTKIDTTALAMSLKADEELRSIPLLGFFSHVQVELQRAAVQAGYDTVVPRSIFSRDLGSILSGTTQGSIEA
ncbi:MAG: hypothetical protein ABJB97_03060 [Acidobacteriota bacterium]